MCFRFFVAWYGNHCTPWSVRPLECGGLMWRWFCWGCLLLSICWIIGMLWNFDPLLHGEKSIISTPLHFAEKGKMSYFDLYFCQNLANFVVWPYFLALCSIWSRVGLDFGCALFWCCGFFLCVYVKFCMIGSAWALQHPSHFVGCLLGEHWSDAECPISVWNIINLVMQYMWDTASVCIYKFGIVGRICVYGCVHICKDIC